jgi:hypothetical protein
VAALASGAVQAAELLTLNVILSLSGFGSLAGGEDQKAFGVAEMAINRQGGIWGRPVHFACRSPCWTCSGF